MFSRILFLISLLVFTSSIMADRTLVVKVEQPNGEAIPGATVYGLRNDSTLIGASLSESDGIARLILAETPFLIKGTSTGYAPSVVPFKEGTDSILLRLSPEETRLEGIEVTASIQRDAEGKEIFTITDEMRKNTNNAANLIAKLPGVSVNQATETIRIGTESDIKVIVDGQEVSRQYAMSLNPKRIKSIEIERNPSGRYAGSNIVVNIILNKSYQGIDLSLQGKYTQFLQNGFSNNEGEAFNVTSTFGKWNLYASEEFSRSLWKEAEGYSIHSEGFSPTVADTPPASDPNISQRTLSWKTLIGIDCNLSSSHVISAQFSYDHTNARKSEDQLMSDPAGNFTSYYLQKYRNNNFVGGIFYHGALGDNWNLSADFIYNRYGIRENRDFTQPLSSSFSSTDGDKDYIQTYLTASWRPSKKWRISLKYNLIWRDYNTVSQAEVRTNLSETRNLPNVDIYFRPVSNFNIRLGGSWQHISKSNDDMKLSESSFMPDARIYWRPFKWMKIIALYYCDVEYPNLDLLSPQQWKVADGVLHVGNPELKAKVMHYANPQITFLNCLKIEYMYRRAANDISTVYLPSEDYRNGVIQTYANSTIIHQYAGIQFFRNLHRDFKIDILGNYQWYQRKYDASKGYGRTWYLDASAEWNIMGKGYVAQAEYFLRDDRIPVPMGREIARQEGLNLSVFKLFLKNRLSVALFGIIPTPPAPCRKSYLHLSSGILFFSDSKSHKHRVMVRRHQHTFPLRKRESAQRGRLYPLREGEITEH